MNIVTRQDGQDLIEYALLVAFIALMAAAAVTALGLAVRQALWDVIVAFMS